LEAFCYLLLSVAGDEPMVLQGDIMVEVAR